MSVHVVVMGNAVGGTIVSIMVSGTIKLKLCLKIYIMVFSSCFADVRPPPIGTVAYVEYYRIYMVISIGVLIFHHNIEQLFTLQAKNKLQVIRSTCVMCVHAV